MPTTLIQLQRCIYLYIYIEVQLQASQTAMMKSFWKSI